MCCNEELFDKTYALRTGRLGLMGDEIYCKTKVWNIDINYVVFKKANEEINIKKLMSSKVWDIGLQKHPKLIAYHVHIRSTDQIKQVRVL